MCIRDSTSDKEWNPKMLMDDNAGMSFDPTVATVNTDNANVPDPPEATVIKDTSTGDNIFHECESIPGTSIDSGGGLNQNRIYLNLRTRFKHHLNGHKMMLLSNSPSISTNNHLKNQLVKVSMQTILLILQPNIILDRLILPKRVILKTGDQK